MKGRIHAQANPQALRSQADWPAYLRVDGKGKYLGAYGSDKAQQRYDTIIARLKRDDALGQHGMTVGELVLVYLEHVDCYFVRDG